MAIRMDAVTLIATLGAKGVELAIDPESRAIVPTNPELITPFEWVWIRENRADLTFLLTRLGDLIAERTPGRIIRKDRR